MHPWLLLMVQVLYTAACAAPGVTGDGSFVPLSIHYQERFSAAGKTAGGYIKREGRPKDDDVLIARLVDRPIRPMFEKGWSSETQVRENCSTRGIIGRVVSVEDVWQLEEGLVLCR